MKRGCEAGESDALCLSKKPRRRQVSLSTFTKSQAQLEREQSNSGGKTAKRQGELTKLLEDQGPQVQSRHHQAALLLWRHPQLRQKRHLAWMTGMTCSIDHSD